MNNWYKNLIVAFLAAITLFNINTLAFDDVDPDASYYNAVQHLRKNGAIVESKYFKPELTISKAEFIKLLVLINNTEFSAKRTADLPFKDTRNTAWYADYFNEAINLGILEDKAIEVKPYSHLTITDGLKLLFNSKSIPIPKKFVGDIPYRDVKNDEDSALIMRAAVLGIIVPEKEDYFGVNKKLTKAMAAQLIFRMEMLDLNSYLQPKSNSSNQQNYDQSLQKIINVWELIKSNYVDGNKLDEKNMSTEAIKGILETIDDPYSAYLDEQANQNFNADIEGKFEGIGAYLSIEEDGNITIVSPIKDSPAYKAGILPGDIIRKVDDFDTKGAGLQEVVSRIKGPKGTDVRLTVEREGRFVEIVVTRGVINIKPVEYETIEDGKIMLAKLVTFNRSAANSMREVAEIISNNKQIKGLILDLRGNPGGLLDSAIDIISLFVPKNSTAVRIKYNYYNVTQSTTQDGILKNFPVVVLINKGSASASEIVAGGLQELIDATVVGETSFGKGTVQEVNFFGDNSSLKITVAKWLTPDGNSIQGNGIKPDVEVIKATGITTDNQLERAIQEINKKIKR